jgi:hypothetical protein
MLMPIIAPLSLIGGVVLATLYSDDPKTTRTRSPLLIATGFGLASLVAFLTRELDLQGALYLGAAAVFGTLHMAGKPSPFRWMPSPPYMRRGLVFLFVMMLIALPVVAVKYKIIGNSSRVRLEREIVDQHLRRVNEESVIFADRRTMDTLRFYFGFSPPTNLRLIRLRELDTFEKSGNDRLFVLINDYRDNPRRQTDEITPYLGHRPPNWKSIHGRDGIYLFEIERK